MTAFTLETINVGTFPNDATGDTLRTAFTKCNDNFGTLQTAIDTNEPDGILIPPTTLNFAQDFAIANTLLLNQGGGNIILSPGAVYTLSAPILLDCGSGVGLIGNGACIDARTMTTPGITALMLATTSAGVMNVISVTSGTLAVGNHVSGNGIPQNVTIASFGTGSGGVGTYNLSSGITVGTTGVIATTTNAWTTALTLGSTPPATSQVAGFDGLTNNYWQNRALVTGFTLLGQGKNLSLVNGIDVNMITEYSQRAPRATVRNVVVQGFWKGLCMRNQSYLVLFDQVTSTNGDNAIYFNGGINTSENSKFDHCVFANCTYGITIDTACETGSAQNFDLIFDTCSTDYNGTQVQYNSGFGSVHFDKGYFEHNNAAALYPHNWQNASNTVQIVYERCRHYYTGSAATGFTNYIYQGNNVQLTLRDNFLNNILGTGATIGNTNYKSLVNRAGSNTRLIVSGTQMFNLPSIPPLISTQTDDNWLGDGGFEQSNLVDYWWLYRAGGIVVTTGSATARTVGTGVAGIAPTTAAFNSGTMSLGITMDATGTHTAGYRVVGLIKQKKGDQFCASFSHFMSAGGTGNFTVIVYAAVVDPQTSQWTSTNFSGLAYYGFPPTITRAVNIGPSAGYTITPSTSQWNVSSFSFNVGLTDDPRIQIPNWATHLFLQIDFSSINNPSGTVYLDDFFINGW